MSENNTENKPSTAEGQSDSTGLVMLPTPVVDKITTHLQQMANILYDGMFSLDDLPIPHEIIRDFIRIKGDVERLTYEIYQYQDGDMTEEAAKRIDEAVTEATSRRLREYDRRIGG